MKRKFVKKSQNIMKVVAGIHKTTIIFNISTFKLSEKYPKLLNLSIGLRFFKNHYKDMKVICNENTSRLNKYLLSS